MQVQVEDDTTAESQTYLIETTLVYTGGEYGLSPVPTISSVEPDHISAGGGDIVRIMGVSFNSLPKRSIMRVEFGFGNSAIATIVSSKELTCVSPPILDRSSSLDDVSGFFVLIRVTNFVDYWSNAIPIFVEMPSEVSSTSPDAGPACGGTTVAMLGQHFPSMGTFECIFGEGDKSVTVPAAWRSPRLVECISPRWVLMEGDEEMKVPLTLSNGQGRTSASSFWFRFTSPIVVTSISPVMGLLDRETTVQFSGFNFNHYDLTCEVADQEAKPTIHGSTVITCVVPPHASKPDQTVRIKVMVDSEGVDDQIPSLHFKLFGSSAIESAKFALGTGAGSPSGTVDLLMMRGRRYWLDQTDESNCGHPVALSATPGGSHSPGGVPWTAGVERTFSSTRTATGGINCSNSPGAGVLSFLIPLDAPDVLYLYSEGSAMVESHIIANITDDSVHASARLVAAHGSACDPQAYTFRCSTELMCDDMLSVVVRGLTLSCLIYGIVEETHNSWYHCLSCIMLALRGMFEFPSTELSP